MTHKVGWRVSIASLQKAGPEGRDALRGAVSELVDVGYLRLSQGRGERGRFNEIEYELCDPFTAVGKPDTGGFTDSGESDTGGFTDNGAADVGESDTKKNISPEHDSEEQKELFVHLDDAPAAVKPDHSSEFEVEFWPVYPRKQAKAPAAKAFAKARRKHSLETITAGVRAYALMNAGGDRTKIKLAAGWLNDERFLDEEQLPNQPAAGTGARAGRETAAERAYALTEELRRQEAGDFASLPVAPRLDDHVHEFDHGCCIRCGFYDEGRRVA
ncbi:hypothetical protein [Agromyces humatus]|nr:hypothetical protein [Agromyces humatus]